MSFSSVNFYVMITSQISAVLQSGNKHIVADAKCAISEDQHGFMIYQTIEFSLVIYTDYILENMDQSSQVDCIYTDFCRSWSLCNLLSLFCLYIRQKSPVVILCRNHSEFIMATSGVPHGSHLRPLLCNLTTSLVAS